jgi:hypothetical protein
MGMFARILVSGTKVLISPTITPFVGVLNQTNATHISLTVPPGFDGKFYRLRHP